jgi:hypothetical protein
VKSLLSYLATVCYVVLTVNSQRKSTKSHTNPIKIEIFVCDFIEFLCEITVKTTKHTVASYESSDFTRKFLIV